MDNPDRNPKLLQLDWSDLLWGALAVIGCLAMIAFEMIAFRIQLGKW